MHIITISCSPVRSDFLGIERQGIKRGFMQCIFVSRSVEMHIIMISWAPVRSDV